MALAFGKVVGLFLAEVGDGADGDSNPDLVPLQGTVTFKPIPPWLLAGQIPATILPAAITCTLDANGFLTFNGQQGVWLQATNDPSINPSGWAYVVSFSLTLSGAPMNYGPFSIQVPSGQTTDLSTATPVASGGGVLTTQGPKGDKGDAGTNGTPIIVLNSIEPVPDGTPAGTIIIRTAA